jgi:8-oxo-dGDP phosphatase
MPRDPYTRLNRRVVYKNEWLAIEAHRIVHPNGAPGEHVVVVTPQACGVLAEDSGYLLFTRQPRFAARQYVTEIVKGGSRADESLLDSAKRELREELGVTAHRWSELGTLHEIPSIVDPPVVLFLARELEYGAAEPSDEESISLVRLGIGAALDAAVRGEIDDAVTVAALFRFAAVTGRLLHPSDARDND